MQKHNIYKDIVLLVAACIAAAGIVKGIQFWNQEQSAYEFTIISQSELTESVVHELGKITGLYQFTPVSECSITLKLEEYTMESTVKGVSFDDFPLKWRSEQTTFRMGNAPVLFLGKDAFQEFTDIHGNPPGKSQITEWISHASELKIVLLDQEKPLGSASICGILEEPAAGIYMDRAQMETLYQELAKTTAGCVKIQGYANLKRAKEILMEAGFQVQEAGQESQ